MLELNKIHNTGALSGLGMLDDESVDCVITSPPYWGLRDYGVDGQLGLEKTFQGIANAMADQWGSVNAE